MQFRVSEAGSYFGQWNDVAAASLQPGFLVEFDLAAPPLLRIARDNQNIILSWPIAATGFVLETTSSLMPSVSWSQVASGPVQIGDRY